MTTDAATAVLANHISATTQAAIACDPRAISHLATPEQDAHWSRFGEAMRREATIRDRIHDAFGEDRALEISSAAQRQAHAAYSDNAAILAQIACDEGVEWGASFRPLGDEDLGW